MAEIIFNLKSVVIVILVSEFMKQLISGEKYKKYINFAISLMVIGFLLSVISGTKLDIIGQEEFNYTEIESSENLIISEYKNKIAERISGKFPKDEPPEFEIEVDDSYNVISIKVKTDYEDTEKILEELGFTDYEIIN